MFKQYQMMENTLQHHFTLLLYFGPKMAGIKGMFVHCVRVVCIKIHQTGNPPKTPNHLCTTGQSSMWGQVKCSVISSLVLQ